MQLSNMSLEECRLLYDREEDRKKTLESKASQLLGFVSLLVIFLNFFLGYFLPNFKTFPEMNSIIIVTIISLVLIVLSLIFLLNVLKIRRYTAPLYIKKQEELESFLNDQEKFEKNIIHSYVDSIVSSHHTNDIKCRSLQWAEMLLGFGVILPMLSAIVVLSFRVF